MVGIKSLLHFKKKRKDEPVPIVPLKKYNECEKYIKTLEEKGYDDSQIRENLLRAGWKTNQIDYVFYNLRK